MRWIKLKLWEKLGTETELRFNKILWLYNDIIINIQFYSTTPWLNLLSKVPEIEKYVW